MCAGYFYEGEFVGVSLSRVKREDPSIVYETEAWSDKIEKEVKMSKPKVLMHKNAMDVALVVTNSQNMEENVDINGYWINLGYTGNPWLVPDGNVKLKIPFDKFFNEWVDISDKYLNPRTKPGLPA